MIIYLTHCVQPILGAVFNNQLRRTAILLTQCSPQHNDTVAQSTNEIKSMLQRLGLTIDIKTLDV